MSLLTAREVADVIGVHPETVLRWTRRGDLAGIRLPGGALRYPQDQLDRWLEDRATPGRGVSPAPASATRPVPYGLPPAPEAEEYTDAS